MIKHFFIFHLLIFFVFPQAFDPTLYIVNKQILKDNENSTIFSEGKLNDDFNDQTFNQILSCRNGNLNIIDITRGNKAIISYSNMPSLNKDSIAITQSPNSEPLPFVSSVNETHFEIDFNCSCGKGIQCTDYNYFNKARIQLHQTYAFSFLINCDPQIRHKQFQIGYLFIALINSAIIIGVAMHSHVWSIRINHRPLRYVLFWKPFLIFSFVGIGVILSLYYFTYRDFWKAFSFIKYFGIIISIFFVFLCLNEILYLLRRLRRPVYKIIRQCDIVSGILTIGVTILAFFYDNWILYNIIAGCICVGSIKIFHFNSLKESFLAMTIMVTTITAISVILHFLLPLSYNDYAGELSSPIFFQVPDLVNNLLKKCSWLPIFDVIIPGVTLSFLRVYDENKSSKYGGVYTLSGNITFVFSTIIWIFIELFDPFSCPFSLITCPLLMLVIFIISWRRNDWTTLLYGQFQQGYEVDVEALTQNRHSFSQLVPQSMISDTLIKQDVRSSILSN